MLEGRTRIEKNGTALGGYMPAVARVQGGLTPRGNVFGMDWFAVRHVVKNQDAYEERITLWQAEDADDAIKKAEAEAAHYVEIFDGAAVLPLSQSFHLSDAPSDGAEVFSLIRRSPLTPDDYLTAFFDTGTELQERAD